VATAGKVYSGKPDGILTKFCLRFLLKITDFGFVMDLHPLRIYPTPLH
jgi:hypothetical protein